MTIPTASHTTASLLYFTSPPDGSKAYQSINAAPATGVRNRNWSPVEHTGVRIENLRGREAEASLDTTGFMFARRPAKHTSFQSDEEIEKEYYPESEELIKELTGASRVVFFDHTIRRRRPGETDDSPSKRQPVPQVHVDQTAASAVARVHRHLPPSLAPSLLQKRFQILNLWRPIAYPAHDWPLALCDYRSVDEERDLEPVTLVYPDREGETSGVKYAEGHRWCYVRGMEPDEVALIKCYDSTTDPSIAKLTPHTAFADPATPPGAPLRQSIELRALVFYD